MITRQTHARTGIWNFVMPMLQYRLDFSAVCYLPQWPSLCLMNCLGHYETILLHHMATRFLIQLLPAH